MITILYQSACEDIAKAIESDLTAAFSGQVDVTTAAAMSATPSIGTPSWDDLLLVVFNTSPFPDNGNTFIREHLRVRHHGAGILPVATDISTARPPREADAIKSIVYADTEESRKLLVNRIGAMIGLRWQGRDSNIFISYREKDGKEIAQQLNAYLLSLGHRPFLDQAREFDGLPRILPGSPVQKEIDQALDAASLVLLIDTPSAAESIWIRHEIETADSLMLPILPLVFRNADDGKKGPRFASLRSLMRWVSFAFNPAANPSPLNVAQLEAIVSEAEHYYCEIFRRKCRVPLLVEKEFTSRDYVWEVLNQRLLMFQSSKKHSARLNTSVLTHCSIFDQVYGPAVNRFLKFLESTQKTNYSLFVYDGDLIPEPELNDIAEEQQDSSLIILHHQELATLIRTNFTTLGAAS